LITIRYITSHLIFFKQISDRSGLGYYDKIDDDFGWEIYAGGGKGALQYTHFDSFVWDTITNNYLNYKYKTDFTKLFIQPNIGLKTKYADFIFSTRFVGINFSNIDTLNMGLETMKDDKVYNLNQQTFMFIEPAITVRFGYKWLKFHIQGIYSNKINLEPINSIVYNISVVMIFNISKALSSEVN